MVWFYGFHHFLEIFKKVLEFLKSKLYLIMRVQTKGILNIFLKYYIIYIF